MGPARERVDLPKKVCEVTEKEVVDEKKETMEDEPHWSSYIKRRSRQIFLGTVKYRGSQEYRDVTVVDEPAGNAYCSPSNDCRDNNARVKLPS
jgi:hypothetical protein